MTDSDMSVVCEFLDVLHEDLCDFPLGSEVEFSIYLVSGTSSMSMGPNRMST